MFTLSSLFIAGIAIALLVPATGAAALFSVEKKNSGAAMGVFTTNAFIGGAIGVAIAGFVLSHAGEKVLRIFLNGEVQLPASMTVQHLEQITSGVIPISSMSHLMSTDLLNHFTQLLHTAFISGFSCMMWLCAGLSFFSSLLTIACNFQK